MSEAVINLIKEKKWNRLTETWQPAVIRKIASLDYCHLENHETEELINRVGKDSAMWIWGGCNLLLYTMEMLIHVGLILSVLAFQVWWSALAATLIFIPLFYLAAGCSAGLFFLAFEKKFHKKRKSNKAGSDNPSLLKGMSEGKKRIPFLRKGAKKMVDEEGKNSKKAPDGT